MRGWLVMIVDVRHCMRNLKLLCHRENFLFFVGLKTWKALQPKGEICLVADPGKKLANLAGG